MIYTVTVVEDVDQANVKAWWRNFLVAYGLYRDIIPSLSAYTYGKQINHLLFRWNACVNEASFFFLAFNTEKDYAVFLLRWT